MNFFPDILNRGKLNDVGWKPRKWYIQGMNNQPAATCIDWKRWRFVWYV